MGEGEAEMAQGGVEAASGGSEQAQGSGTPKGRSKNGASGMRTRPHLVSLLALDTGPKRMLVVDGPGLFLGKHSERLRVTYKGEVQQEVPLMDLEHVLIVGRGVSLSSDAVAVCAEHGIALDILSDRDEPQATLIPSAVGATVKTRRHQLAAFHDERGAHLARAFAHGKLLNQARLLRYLAKNRRESRPQDFEAAAGAAVLIEGLSRRVQRVDGAGADAVRQAVLTLEGQAGDLYWQTARRLLLAPVEWEGRETRGAQDAVNCALNYGYKILYSRVQRAVCLAGLDPFGGFLHVDRPGKPSLVLDMVEEFRQMVVDRCIFALFNQGVHMDLDDDGLLPKASRDAIVKRIEERLESAEPYEGKRVPLRIIVQWQARRVASFLRGERDAYRPFVGRW